MVRGMKCTAKGVQLKGKCQGNFKSNTKDKVM